MTFKLGLRLHLWGCFGYPDGPETLGAGNSGCTTLEVVALQRSICSRMLNKSKNRFMICVYIKYTHTYVYIYIYAPHTHIYIYTHNYICFQTNVICALCTLCVHCWCFQKSLKSIGVVTPVQVSLPTGLHLAPSEKSGVPPSKSHSTHWFISLSIICPFSSHQFDAINWVNWHQSVRNETVDSSWLKKNVWHRPAISLEY